MPNTAFWGVEHLNVIEDVAARLFTVEIGFSTDTLPLELLKDALGDGVVVAISSSAHADHQAMDFQEGLPFMADVLTSLIGMDDHGRRGISPPDGQQQGIDRQLAVYPRAHRSTDHLA